MKIAQIKAEDLPVVPQRSGLEVKDVELSALKETGVGLVSYGLKKGDRFEFPDSVDDCKIVARQVRKNSTSYEMLILGLKNGKPAYFSLANLRRRDADMKPVHPVADALASMENDEVRVEACLGRVIVAGDDVTYQERVFQDGVRTEDTRPRTTAKLEFA